MPDTRRTVGRARSRSTAPHSQSSPAQRAGPPSVIGALLRGQPELTLLRKAAAGIATIELVDDRFALVATILARRPAAIVLPPYDDRRTSTAPLVLRVRREAPQVEVIVIASHPTGAGQPMLRSAKAGARVITSPTTAELQTILAALLEPRTATDSADAR
jgi:hypothetical protein